MVNKKGDGHVDWIISIGIFLIFLLSIFVIFRPGIQPSQNYNTLLDILSDKIKQDWRDYNPTVGAEDFGGFYWTLYRIPLFFQEFKTGVTGKNCIFIDFPYNENNLISDDKINVIKIKDGIISNLPKKLSIDGNKLYIEELTSWDPNSQYIIYFSDNEFYSGKGESGDILDITDFDADCTNSNDINYNLGIIEKTRGVANEILNILSDKSKQTYDNVKTIYGYPQSKEFSITITKGNEESKYMVVAPDVKTNVYTREWGDFILNYDGTREAININLKVW